MKSYAITMTAFYLASAISARAQEPPLSTFYDTAGVFSGTYICVGEAAGGIRYDDKTKKWIPTHFRVDNDKFIIKVTATGRTTYDTGFSPVETVMGYSVEYSVPGSGDTQECYLPEGVNGKIVTNGRFRCQSALTRYQFNLISMRYMEAYESGFIDGEDNNDNTPSITIGYCSKF